MSKKSEVVEKGRREFFKDVAVIGGAALVAAVAVRPSPADASSAAAKPDAAPKGYRVTPHILDYYDKAGL